MLKPDDHFADYVANSTPRAEPSHQMSVTENSESVPAASPTVLQSRVHPIQAAFTRQQLNSQATPAISEGRLGGLLEGLSSDLFAVLPQWSAGSTQTSPFPSPAGRTLFSQHGRPQQASSQQVSTAQAAVSSSKPVQQRKQ